MSLRHQPLRRGLIAGFAVTLFGSLIAIGCVQGPKGAFNRVWGPESYAAKTSKAIKGLATKKETAVDEDTEKLADSKDAKKKAKNDALAQAAGTKDAAAKKGGVGAARSSKKSEFASTAKKGDIAAPFVNKKRNAKLNELEDPFLKDLDRTEIAANTRKPAPSKALNSPKPADAKPGIAFAKGFDTQLSQIKADVAREKALAESIKKKAEADAAAMAAARREVDALMTQAQAADKRGNLVEAKKLAHTADELVASRKILLTGAERPEDFLQKIREKEVAQETAKKLQLAATAAPSLPDDDGVELRRSIDAAPKATAVARKEQVVQPAKAPARPAAMPIEEEQEQVAERQPAPQVQIKVQRVAIGQPLPPALAAAQESRIEARREPRMTGRPAPIEQAVAHSSLNGRSQVRENDANGDMIFDSRVVDWRFPIQNRTSPAASDYDEVQVSYEEVVARRNSQRGRVTANGNLWNSSKEGRVRTNRGSVVNANGERGAARLSRGDSAESIGNEGRIQMSSHSVRDGRFAENAGTRMTDTSAPELLESSECEQPAVVGVEAKPAESSVDDRSNSSNGWSFLLGVGVAAICAVGFAFRNRGQIETPRS